MGNCTNNYGKRALQVYRSTVIVNIYVNVYVCRFLSLLTRINIVQTPPETAPPVSSDSRTSFVSTTGSDTSSSQGCTLIRLVCVL